MGYIYKITNKITNKCYIGETKQTNPESRWKENKNTIKNGTGCPALKDASRQTGIPNSTIKKCVKDNKPNRGFIWKKE